MRTEMPTEILQRLARAREDLGAVRLDQVKYALSKITAALHDDPRVLAIRGLLECRFGRFREGVTILARAYELDPDSEPAALDLGEMLWHAGQREQGFGVLQRHYERRPGDWRVLKLMCGLLRQTNNIGLANEYIARLIAVAPDDAEALQMIAARQLDLRQYDASMTSYDRVLANARDERRAGRGKVFAMLYAGSDPLEIRAVTERFAQAAYPEIASTVAGQKAVKAALPVGRTLRVGYVSGDFRRHVVMRFFGRLLVEHDRSRVHVTCYYSGTQADDQTEFARRTADRFRDIGLLPDATAADMIRADGIDVLVDLAGHTEDNRLGVFARRPAPVQATYLGYPATTGLAQMDYRISDALADPVGLTETHYTEKIIRLPRCAWAYAPFGEADASPLTTPPFQARDAVVTFGSLNLLTKVNQPSVSLWGRLLAKAGAKGRLYMTDRRGLLNDPEAEGLLRAEILSAGVEASRVVLAGWVADPAAHRARLAEIDLMLDPLSYNGTTTTAEALLAGIPTLTLPGSAHVSRVGASLMSAVGLNELICGSPEEFVEKGATLAEHPERLAAWRAELPAKFKASPLGDHAGLARALEDAYYDMVREKAGQ